MRGNYWAAVRMYFAFAAKEKYTVRGGGGGVRPAVVT